jgi:hypothetical protein
MHALAKASTVGVLLILTGAAVNLRDVNDITSVVLAAILHVLTCPPASNMVSRATYLAEGMPTGQVVIDEGAVPLRMAPPAPTERGCAPRRPFGRRPTSPPDPGEARSLGRSDR